MQTWFLDFVANIKIKETGIVMDTFIDKLAQKKNAQEMIRANSAAEAVKMDQMQKQMKAYDELMQEIRRVNIKTAENVDNVRDLLAQCMEKLESLEKESGQAEDVEKQLAGIKSLLEERLTQSEEFMHRENVKVYRNVQAAFTEEFEKQRQQEQPPRGRGLSVGLSVAILIGVAVDIVINLIPIINSAFNLKLFY
jgi:ElaB/YqjD/DUF883 family membrane-anchored ribosome-binding protein